MVKTSLVLGCLIASMACVGQDRTGSYSAADLDRIWSGIKDQCHQIAIAEDGGKPLYDKCISYQKAEWKIWAGFYADPSVSWLVWTQCGQQTSFNTTLNVHEYNACIRLSKGRSDLKD